MKILERITAIIIIFSIIMTSILQNNSNNNNFSASASAETIKPVKTCVLFSNFSISAISLLMENMKKIEQENLGTVEYTFYNGQGSQDIQNNQLNTILAEKKADLILLDVVNIKYTKYAVDRIKEDNIPVIFLANAEISPIMSYSKAFLVGTNPPEGGVLQGKIIIESWTNNKGNIDRNKDNILQYIMLQGTPSNIYAVERTKYSVLAINEGNISTQELALRICNWNKEEAKAAIKDLFLQFGNKIEAIIANDDMMAIGAIEALQEYGYNLNNSKQRITVVGFDGIQQAQDLISKGIMTGTVVVDLYNAANNFYIIGMNLIHNKNLIEGTNCTIDNTGKIITAPYDGILVNFNK